VKDARAYWIEIAQPTIEEFLGDFTSRRRAFLACAAMVHVVDYIAFSDGRPKPAAAGNLRKSYGVESHAFLLVDRVAHAFKHVHSSGLPAEEGGDKVTGDSVSHVMEVPRELYGAPGYDIIARMKQVPLSVMTAGGWTDLRATILEASQFLADKLAADDGEATNESPTVGG
jgi:hypothetical protein